VIVRPLTHDFDWDQYFDLTNRAFGPADEAMVQPSIEPVVAAGRCLAAFDGDRMAGIALYHDMRQWWHGSDQVFIERVVASSAATTRALWAVAASNSTVAETARAQVGPSDPLWWMLREQDANIAERESWMLLAEGGGPDADAALDGAFAATPFMLDGF